MADTLVELMTHVLIMDAQRKYLFIIKTRICFYIYFRRKYLWRILHTTLTDVQRTFLLLWTRL